MNEWVFPWSEGLTLEERRVFEGGATVVRRSTEEEIVDGGRLPLGQHARRIAGDLSLSPVRMSLLASEIRNALVPAIVAAESLTVERRPEPAHLDRIARGAGRILALADELERMVDERGEQPRDIAAFTAAAVPDGRSGLWWRSTRKGREIGFGCEFPDRVEVRAGRDGGDERVVLVLGESIGVRELSEVDGVLSCLRLASEMAASDATEAVGGEEAWREIAQRGEGGGELLALALELRKERERARELETRLAQRRVTDVDEVRVHLSARGLPLVWMRPPRPDRTIVTVENYVKWYGLHLIRPDGTIEEIPFPSGSPSETAYADHVPNPEVVKRFASERDNVLDEQAIEMIAGRWQAEYMAREAS